MLFTFEIKEGNTGSNREHSSIFGRPNLGTGHPSSIRAKAAFFRYRVFAASRDPEPDVLGHPIRRPLAAGTDSLRMIHELLTIDFFRIVTKGQGNQSYKQKHDCRGRFDDISFQHGRVVEAESVNLCTSEWD